MCMGFGVASYAQITLVDGVDERLRSVVASRHAEEFIDLGFETVVILLGSGRADIQEMPSTCQRSWRNSDCQFSNMSRPISIR